MSFDNDIDLMESIEACRTCGVFFLTSSCYLRPIFTAAVEDPEMMHIRMELNAWKVEINENDGYPQFICTGCIHEFKKIFDFRRSCVNIQQQLLQFYNLRTKNQIQIKTELPDEMEENVRDFIYVDDLSDGEYDGTPFNIPHVPIKEEIIEEATVPTDTPTTLIGTANTNIEPSDMQQNINISNEIEGAALLNNTIADSDLNQTTETGDEAIVIPVLENSKGVAVDNEDPTSTNTLHFKCEYCNCISPNKQQHKLHLKRVHDIKDMECHICGKTFKNSSAARLKFHLKWHKLSKHIKCVQCGFYSDSRDILNDHVRQVHCKDNCAICGKFVYPKKMKQHMRTHGFDTLFECTYCTKVFRNAEDVNEHISAMHGNVKSVGGQDSEIEDTSVVIEVLCILCDTKFPNQAQLEIHMHEQHLNDESSNLNKASEEYNLMYAVRDEVSHGDHELFNSMKEDSEKLYCLKCHQEFLHRDALTQHMQQCQSTSESTGDMFSSTYNRIENEYLDNYQNKVDPNVEEEEFIDEQVYVDRSLPDVAAEAIETINEVNQLKPLPTFGCAQCTDTFQSVEQLRDHHDQMHDTIYSKKSNFDCHICGKVFELKFSLNRHLKKHNL